MYVLMKDSNLFPWSQLINKLKAWPWIKVNMYRQYINNIIFMLYKIYVSVSFKSSVINCVYLEVHPSMFRPRTYGWYLRHYYHNATFFIYPKKKLLYYVRDVRSATWKWTPVQTRCFNPLSRERAKDTNSIN